MSAKELGDGFHYIFRWTSYKGSRKQSLCKYVGTALMLYYLGNISFAHSRFYHALCVFASFYTSCFHSDMQNGTRFPNSNGNATLKF